ncbi:MULTISPECIES: GNAT family N-acetyltransferase [unclassified Arthrobacter]|uniref:GNAT family N-acetyltransferase n=1 Tax=unclassified Arthrobacter TaxID=235627 RepID=UPI00159DBD18|nr:MULTISPECIES: GNAT family N-acetyltransferase [unclassified Arthrobacter]MCQ9165151.1 GNAT family N-acetyltransferase [Arthrobacter sp. STN4]NVM99755.1 GNAT family N-acetyltransferase [Arthrobacter sp. SDTb3-6]
MTSGSTELGELLDAWFAGWTALRSYRTSFETGYHAALRLDRSGDWEYFISDPEPADFAVLAAKVAQAENRAVSVLGPDIHRYVAQGHAAGLGMLSASEQMMVARMEIQDNQDPFLGDPELTLKVDRMGGRRAASTCQARFSGTISRGGLVLASGKVAVYGDYAVFDQIETHADHRRRGYGRLLMQSLAASAKEYPVTTGLLLASTDGQRLYAKMGWRNVSAVTVLVPRARLERDMAAG